MSGNRQSAARELATRRASGSRWDCLHEWNANARKAEARSTNVSASQGSRPKAVFHWLWLVPRGRLTWESSP